MPNSVSSNKLRILIVIGSLSLKHGGPSKVCLEMAQALAELGHQVDIFTTDQDGPRRRADVPLGIPIPIKGVTLYYFRADSLKIWPAASRSLARGLRDNVTRYDIVHSNSLYLHHGIAVSRSCRRAGVPYVVRPCGALDNVVRGRHPLRKLIFEWLFERSNLRHASAIHFTSTAEMEGAARVVPVDNGVVVPLGINVADYERPKNSELIRRTFPGLQGKRLVLFLGRLSAKKGLDILIPAFAEVSRAFPDAHLVVAGPDDEGLGVSARQWVNEHGISDRVLFTGMLEGELKLSAFHSAEFFVLPSYGENFGVAVVEALASGLPVLISPHVAIWRTLKDGGAALVTETRVEAVASAMKTLLADPELRRNMGKKAKAVANAHYSWKHVVSRLEELYGTIAVRSAMVQDQELLPITGSAVIGTQAD